MKPLASPLASLQRSARAVGGTLALSHRATIAGVTLRALCGPTIVGATLALLLAASSARADTVHLTDGRTVQGRTSQEGDEVVVKQKFGEVRFARALVQRIDKEDDVYSQLERKQKELGEGTADERYTLGVWAREHGFDAESKAAFLSVLKLDPDHAGARAALGYVKEDGRWVTEDDRMRAQGLVKFDGRWMTPADKVRSEAAIAERRARDKETARRAEEEKAARQLARLQDERQARLARIRAYEEELARARARQRAEDESTPAFTYYQGPVGPYGYAGCFPAGGYSYWAGPTLSNDDLLIYSAVAGGRYRYPTYARPFTGRVVTFSNGGAGCAGGYDASSGWGSGFYGSSDSSSFGFGVQLQGSWTSRSGRSSIRFRSGF